MLCSSSPSIPAASDTTQRALIQLERRSEHWCLPLNPGKCEACFFSMDPHQANLLSHFSLLNYLLRFSPTYTFFGVTFNRTLIFYSSILAKGQVLRPYTKHPASSWEISKELLFLLCKAFFSPLSFMLTRMVSFSLFTKLEHLH